MRTRFAAPWRALAVVLLSGCIRSRVTHYGPSAPMSTAPIQAFRTRPPERPYEELGEITVEAGLLRRGSMMDALLARARAMGADAVIVLEHGQYVAGVAVATNAFGAYATPIPQNRLTGVAIRWTGRAPGSPESRPRL